MNTAVSKDESVSGKLAQIQNKIVNKQFAEAFADTLALREEFPENDDLLYMGAVCQRFNKQFPTAIEWLETLLERSPDNGRAWQELGHNYRDMGALEDAFQAYLRACQLSSALVASWQSLFHVAKALGREQQAQFALANLKRLEQIPKPLIAIAELIGDGKLLKAEALVRQFLQKVPHHPEAMRLLADIGLKFGVLSDAEFLLQCAVEFAPNDDQIRIDYVQVLRKRQYFTKALEQAKYLLEQHPQQPKFMSLYAINAMQAGDYDEAINMFDNVLQAVPDDPVTLTSKGHALKTQGHADEAIKTYQRATIAHPTHGEAYYSLANLKTYKFTDDEVVNMQQQEQNKHLSYMDRVYLSFAMGKAFEDRKDFESSFNYYSKGNALKKKQSRYTAKSVGDEMRRQQVICTPELFDKHRGAGCKAPDPIFVLGLPRAGSTLVEQILSSHSQIEGTQELPNILSLSQMLRRRGDGEHAYPDILSELTSEEITEFGNTFIEETQVHRHGRPFFIDKMPNNFRHIGLIKLILPNAKIIDARRNPMSCGFSVFKQLFAEGQEFSYSLEDIGEYYRDYVDLMNYWDQALPGQVHRIQHEDVVADLETEVRRLLDYLELPFEQSCVEYHKTERNVRTPSSEQVRQPIFTSSLEQWKNYEPWLDPLKEALGPDLRP